MNWYKGKTKHHTYKIYNGKKYNTYNIKSLNIASQSCNDLSDFYFNEKLDITINNEQVQKKIKEILENNNFLHNANKLMQLTEAMGTGAFVPYLENGEVKINFLNATNIIILKSTRDTIIDVMFWSTSKTADGTEYTFNTHILKDNGYVIKNKKVVVKNKTIKEIDIPEEIKEIETKSNIPRFGIIFTPLVNNFDINSPYGISSFANAIDNILSIDKVYDCLDNEISLGRKRVYVKGGATKFNTDEEGNVFPMFDESDIAYYQMPGDEKDPLITESSFDLRIDKITEALQAQLNLYSSKVGLGHNYYKFKDGEVYVNTTNVISSNSDMFRKIKKQENILTNAIINVIYAIAELIGIKKKFSVSVFYDDSIIEDTEQIRKQAQIEYNSKLISKAQYYRDVYKLKDQEALTFAKQMNDEIMEETITDGSEFNLTE